MAKDGGLAAKFSKVEISPDEIGAVVSSANLFEYDPGRFQAVIVQASRFSEMQEYLLRYQCTFQYIGTSGAVLVPNDVAQDLKTKFEGRTTSIYNRTRGLSWPPAGVQ